MSLTRLKSPDAAARWLREWVTGTLRADSRQVQPGDAFIAWPGYATDGRQFARSALVAGAATCLVEHEGVESFAFDNARIASLPQLKAATGPIADAFFGHPSAQMDVVATTGTNGKTSTAWWTAQALAMLGRRCGVIGTLGIGEPPLAIPATAASTTDGQPSDAQPGSITFTGLTTPDPVTLHRALRTFHDGGIHACAIEASSIGIAEHRLDGLRVRVALFTNFTQDHLDYHGSMEAYWAAKRALFDWPGLKSAVINIDDPQGEALAREPFAAERWTVSAQQTARLRAQNIGYADGGLAFEVIEGDRGALVRSTLIGDFNVHNLLVVIGGLRALGVSLHDAASVVPFFTPVPGRMQRVQLNSQAPLPELVVDYAHTPDALEKALLALRPFAQARGGRLICVFGCGGNRDATKRPQMGAIAARLAQRVLLTSDNPRGEDPEAILAQIAAGIERGHVDATVIADRRAAIAEAVNSAGPNDVILLAGKGHEDYQEIQGVKHPFSDAAEALAALAARQAQQIAAGGGQAQ
ncbi:UDP-N-acetylmuramoyl-L-alanyl-D-glutamate--2,6-diaminopimelate ligase [Aquincola sp. J276]|uniref:UDP-N-acetylmuramoyl-L-alanyl-D-glutamate--2, 6-diaminopimelate ligase n=1 Tax=Aquincola sp. J276 TaxID=2898432 RepID=UPI002150CD39|nr:UDP-N-acetylmuramoyl-L-alanyl-D-glutamate--2,6-diaminopimelate ligase [Aquincola sp. J276]MCR5866718.1 UDP-N-acetylmuramoyl-L-alanyl-D-glutamate--2,6-diaminopimelate ligase [Aquincola sp. J276]